MSIRLLGRRFAWLMTGAAIGTTVVLVLVLIVPLALAPWTVSPPLALGVVLAVLLGGLLGLVPGVRELGVTGARTMLGVDTDLVVPARPALVHRFQDVVWVQLHLALGLLAAGGLTMLLPASVVTLVEVVEGPGPGSFFLVPDSVPARLGIAVAAVALMALALGASWPLGALATRLAPRLLGPTSRDRLELALARIDRETERTRIARDLHDGIGHALTVVSIQAAAGGRVLDRDPAATAAALARIERIAHDALVELDDVLAGLRDEGGGGRGTARTGTARTGTAGHGTAETGSAGTGSAEGGAAGSGSAESGAAGSGTADGGAFDVVLADHRHAGMDLRDRIELPPALPALQLEHLARIVTELLTNAHRHGGPGPVDLRIHDRRDLHGEPAMLVEVRNPLPPTAAAPALGGRGLPGLRERLALWGGTLEAGPHDGTWRALAEVPILSGRTRDDGR